MKNVKNKKMTNESIWKRIEKARDAVFETVGNNIEFAFDNAEESRRNLMKVATKAAKKVEDQQGLVEQKKMEVKAKFETLEVQLKLGKSDFDKDAKKKIKNAKNSIRDFEAQFESDIEFTDEQLENEWIEESLEFEEAMNALLLQYEIEQLEVEEEKAAKKAEIKNKFGALKQKIKDRRDADFEEISNSLVRLGEQYGENAKYYSSFK